MHNELDIYANKYGFYAVPRSFSERVVPTVLAKGQVYEPNTIALIRRKAGDGDVVAGGAFVGDFLPAISEALVDDAKVHSFEPNPISFAAAEQTIALNGLSNVAIHPVAVGRQAGKLHLRTVMRDGTIAAARARVVRRDLGDATVEVEVTTLDSLVPPERNVTVVQLDLEGHEREALLGAQRLLSQCHPLVILEIGKNGGTDPYLALLDQLAPEARYVRAGWIERNAIYLAQA